MAGDPTILFCVGATKAGTTWFYRYLHDHPECHMRSIKELHYFDTVDFGDYARQADVYARLRADLEAKRAEATGWTEKNLARQIADIDEIEAVIAKGDAGEADYIAYLMRGLGQAKTGEDHRLVGDITPSYALLSQDRLARMAALSPRHPLRVPDA